MTPAQETSERELLACPFCGGLGELQHVPMGFGGVKYRVNCQACECRHPLWDTAETAKREWNTRAAGDAPAWQSFRLGDLVEVRQGSSSFAGDWQRVQLKVVGLHIEPNGHMWADVIEGDARHRGNGRYDGETTDFDCDHLSLVSRPDRNTESIAPENGSVA